MKTCRKIFRDVFGNKFGNKFRISRAGLLFLLTSALAVGGCKQLGVLLYMGMPAQTKDIKAEFSGLKNHSIAIVIYCDEETQYENHEVRMTLGTAIAHQLRRNVKKIKVIKPGVVARFQDENLHWGSMHKWQMAANLDADYVLFISLIQYSMRVPGQVSGFQGRITAEPKLYSRTDKDDEPVWEAGDIMEVVFPKVHASYDARNEPKIRYQTEVLFADQLAKCFYDYTIEIKEDDADEK